MKTKKIFFKYLLNIISSGALLLLPFLTVNSKLMPFKPSLELSQDFLSPADTLTLKGLKLIQNLDSAYKISLIKLGEESALPLNLDLILVDSEHINLALPENINYGDYQIEFQFKSLYLKTPKQTLAQTLKIRPAAISDLKLTADVLLRAENLPSLFQSQSTYAPKLILNSHDIEKETEYAFEHATALNYDDETDPELLRQRIISNNLKIGLNSLQIYTIENGFKSLASPEKTFYYLPQDSFQQELFITSQPFSVSMKRNFTNELIDISSITKQEQKDTGITYYLNALEVPYYLSKTVESFALKIDSMRAIGDEFAVLKNSGAHPFKLKKCRLADSVKIRFEFAQDIELFTGASLIVNGDLGLNNTGSDSLALSCEIDRGSGLSYVVLDQFLYSRSNESGLAIRD